MTSTISGLLIACLLVGLVWKGYQLTRLPRSLPLQAIVAFLAFALLGRVLREVAGAASLARGGPVWAAVGWHGPVSVASIALLFFFDAATLARDEALHRARRYVLALLLFLAAIVAMAAAAPQSVSRPHMSVIYFAANLFASIVFAVCARSALRYARLAERRLAIGLRLAAAGFAVIAATSAVFVAVDVIYWFTGSVPIRLAAVTGIVSFVGIVAAVIGLLVPAALMRLTAIRVWWQHGRTYHDLNPLWTVLHQAFPEDQFTRVPPSRWDAMRVWQVHRRYYRRVIECRDGLVRISPEVARLRQAAPDSALADLLQDALRDRHGVPHPQHAAPIAIPTEGGVDAEIRELVALSRALDRNALHRR